MKTIMKMGVNKEGVCSDVRNHFIYLVQINFTLRAHRALHGCENIVNELCLN